MRNAFTKVAMLLAVAVLPFANGCATAHFRFVDSFREGSFREGPSREAGGAAVGAREAFEACARDPELRAACCDSTAADADGDGLADTCETMLGARFAPILYHSNDESNFPTNVDAFLASTSLNFYDDACAPDFAMRVQDAPSQAQLIDHTMLTACGTFDPIASNGTRSRHKGRTFYLSDVALERRAGDADSRNWTTYLHAYPSEEGTITLQYWRFYAFNDAMTDHGGDWEGLHIVLDRERRPLRLRLLGHTQVRDVEPRELVWEGSHVRVFSEGGGHATRPSGDEIAARGCDRDPCFVDPDVRATFIRQETWGGGHVDWPSGAITPAGALVDVGEKRSPKNGQLFVQYGGLWGSPGVLFATSGYWGPAFNETDMGDDGFDTAWCAGMLSSRRQAECFATAVSD